MRVTSAWSTTRSISTCIQDSRRASGADSSTTPSSMAPTVCRAPVMSRVTSNWGWMTTCTLCSSRDELHGHRVDEERHVVGDDLDHRVSGRRPAGVGGTGGDDPHRGGALRSRLREPVVGGQRAVQVLGAALDEVLGGDVAVVGDQEVLDLVVGGSPRALRVTRGVGGAGEQFGLVVLERGEHAPTLGPGCDGHNTGSAVNVSSTRHPVVTGPAASAMMSRMSHTHESRNR